MALPSYRPPEEIEALCEQFHSQYNPDRIIPVPIEEIVEAKLGLDIVPVAGLRNSHDIGSPVAIALFPTRLVMLITPTVKVLTSGVQVGK